MQTAEWELTNAFTLVFAYILCVYTYVCECSIWLFFFVFHFIVVVVAVLFEFRNGNGEKPFEWILKREKSVENVWYFIKWAFETPKLDTLLFRNEFVSFGRKQVRCLNSMQFA